MPASYAPPGLPEKRPDLPFHGVLGNEPEPEWAEDLDQTVFCGYRYMEEVIFYHRVSRTLILADMLQFGHSDSPPLTRLVTRLYGIYERPGLPPAIKLMFRDKAAARTSLERVLLWNFERIVIAHGHVIETGGKSVLRNAYSFLY